MQAFQPASGAPVRKNRADDDRSAVPPEARSLLQAFPEPIFIVDPNSSQILEGNPAALKLVQGHEKGIHHLHLADLCAEQCRSVLNFGLQHPSHRPLPIQWKFSNVEGEIFLSSGTWQGNPACFCVFRESRAREIMGESGAQQALEEALAEGEQKFQALAEIAPSAIFLSQGKHIVYANPAAERITGYTREELLAAESQSLIHPDSKPLIGDIVRASKLGQPVPGQYELKIIHKSGSPRLLQCSTGSVQLRGQLAVIGIAIDITDQRSAERALQHSESLFRSVVEQASDIISILDPQGIVRYESPSILRLLGYHPEEMVGKNSFDFVHPDDLEIVLAAFERAVTDPRSEHAVELRLRHRDGNYRLFEAASNRYREGDKVSGIIASFRYISDRREAENALRDSEERYRQLFQRNLAGVYVATPKGKVLDCNDSFAHIFGYVSREDVLDRHTLDLYQDEGQRKEFLEQLMRKGAISNLEMALRRKNGSLIWILENVSLIEDPGTGKPLIQGTLVDITERKIAEQALTESENKFRAVAETASSAIYIHNGTRFLYVNRASAEITGYPIHELLAMAPAALIGADRPADQERSPLAAQGDEIQFRTKSGETRWLEVRESKIVFDGEQALLGTAFDITERRRVAQLQSAMYSIAERSHGAEDMDQFYAAAHEIISRLMYAQNFYIALLDSDGKTLHFPYFTDQFDGEPPPRKLRKGCTEYVIRTRTTLLADQNRLKELERLGEIEPLGSACIDWLGAPLLSGNRCFGVIAVQSYSLEHRHSEQDKEVLNFVSQHVAVALERKRNEEALRDSETRYRSLVQRAVYGIFSATLDGHFADANPAVARMLGYSTVQELLPLSLPHDIYASPEEYFSLIASLQMQSRVEDTEVQWKRQDGRTITVRLNGRVVLGENEKPVGLEMIAEDVTERSALEEQLRQAQKMEAVGRLAGGVAHDFNNLLTVIKGYSELMMDELDPSDPLCSEVDEIRKASDRAATLTRQLLAFSRKQVLAPRIVDLNTVIGNMDNLLRRLLGEDIILKTALDPRLGRVKADLGQIEQVIMNLSVNARDAMPKGGKLTVETCNVDLDEIYSREHMSVKPGSYVMIAVSDTGVGMTAETRNRIFEPFFTTKEIGKGTGLGLSTVYGIVKQSEGYVWVYSELGLGTTFKVYLPRVDATLEPPEVPSGTFQVYRGTETVLLVEDEDGVRSFVRQVLRRNGYTVLEASHGAEALALCETHPGKIDILLTDVVLQFMSGREIAETALRMRPGLRVIYISGYTPDAILQHGVVTHSNGFLQKPFTAEALARKLREALNSDSSLG